MTAECKLPTLIISAGGTGGHIFPALAVAKQLETDYQIVWVGGNSGMEVNLVPQHGYPLEQIAIGGVRKKGILRKLLLPLTMFKALIAAIKIIHRHQPVIVVGFGGYAAFPIGFAARLVGKPLIIHEQNSVAGLTNRILSKVANQVLTAFPNVLASKKTLVVGNPVRQDIIGSGSVLDMLESLPTDKLRILVVGGSLGAQVLNDTVPTACARIPTHVALVTHQIGKSGDVDKVTTAYLRAGVNAKVIKFIDNMAEAYHHHDVIICRAGASTVAEVAAAGICAIFVPYPHAVDDHQTGNALYLVREQAAYLLPQTSLTPESLANQLVELTPETCNQLAIAARKLAITDSTARIVSEIKKFTK